MPTVRVTNTAKIEKSHIDLQRRVVGCQLIQADYPNRNGLIMRRKAIENALDSYMRDWQVVGRMHTEITNSYPVRVWQDWEGNGWMEVYVTDDEDWERICNCEYTGMSWAGYCEVEPLEGGMRMCTEHAEMLENSFVDHPAVPTAVFQAEGEQADEEDDWLITKLKDGKIKPRITREKNRGLLGQISKLMEPVLHLIKANNIDLASGEESVMSSEDEMTPEQIAALKAELKAELQAELKAELETAAETSEVTETKETAAAEQPAPLTADAIAAALQPLINTAVEAAVTPLKEELAAIGKQSAGSQQLASDGSGEDATKPAGLRPRKRLK